jgi:amidase
MHQKDEIGMSSIDHTLSASELTKALAEGRIGSRELLEHYLARIAQRNEPVNAVIALNAEQARRRADEADAAMRRGERWGPLHGLPMTIKDTWEVPGMPCTAGAPQYRDHRPQQPAAVVQRLQQAGAIIFGKTNVPYKAVDIQTDNPVHGLSRNPWAPELTTGGSSGGAAAALACGFTPLEVGSDIGGSIRIPAHFCGVYGHKSTHGIVSMRGHVPVDPGHIGEPELAVAGPMARSADDLALVLDLIAAPPATMQPGWRLDLPAPKRERLADFRVLMWTDDPDCPIDSRLASAYRDLAAQLTRAGVLVSHGAPVGLGLKDLYPNYTLQMGAVMKAWLTRAERMDRGMVLPLAGWTPALMRGLGKVVSLPHSIDKFVEGMAMSHGQWLALIEDSLVLRERFITAFAQYDVILAPPTMTTAFPHDASMFATRRLMIDGRKRHYSDLFMWIAPATLLGLPATSAPVARTVEGLPVNVQIIGAPYEDRTTIRFAQLLAQMQGRAMADLAA